MRNAVITGANGSVGLGIANLLLSEYLNSITIHLVCRNSTRGEEAIQILLKGHPLVEKGRLVLVLCDLSSRKSVQEACEEIKKNSESIDLLFLNAGIMLTNGIDLKKGVVNILTRPSYVARTGGDILKQPIGSTTDDGMGLVFACNVFGHYSMVKLLTPLLQKSTVGGRVVWCSSTTAIPEFFDYVDYQGILGRNPYESSKRLCELISMAMQPKLEELGIYTFVSSPGNVLSGISAGQVASIWILMALYLVIFV